MQPFKDYYQILGIAREATASEIKVAYRDLALKYHPDQNDSEEAHERFLEISEAYDILSDQSSRSRFNTRYDRANSIKAGNHEAAFSRLEATRRKRANRYGRYTQRVKYRGGSVNPGSFSPESQDRNSKRENGYNYSEAYIRQAIVEGEAAIRSFQFFAKVLRILTAGILLLSVFMIADKYLAYKSDPEIVVRQQPMRWTFSTPGTIGILTESSYFGVKKEWAPLMENGTEVVVRKSPFGRIPVRVYIIDEYGEQSTEVYGTLYAPPFFVIWLFIIFGGLTLITWRSPELNAHLGTIGLVVAVIVYALIFL